MPVLLTCCLQWVVLAAVFWVSGRGGRFLLICAAYAVPFDFLLFAMENLFFLLFPTRLAAATPGDFQALGGIGDERQMEAVLLDRADGHQDEVLFFQILLDVRDA